MDSEESVTKSSKKSRSSGIRKSHRSTKHSRNSSGPRSNEPRRTKRSKEEHEGMTRARAERDNGAAGTNVDDHAGAVGRNKFRIS